MFPAFFRTATPEELTQRQEQSFELLSLEPRQQPIGAASRESDLSQGALAYLKLIAETGDLSVRQRDTKFHISPKKGLALRKLLLQLSLVRQQLEPQAKGRPREILSVTEKGRARVLKAES